MKLRRTAVSGACCALLAVSLLCPAADAAKKPKQPKEPKKQTAADSTKAAAAAAAKAQKAAAPKAKLDHPPASIGGMVGGAGMFADGDYSNTRTPTGEYGDRDAAARFAFAANFRYSFNHWLRWQVSPGFFWVGYDHTSPLPFQDVNNPDDTTKEKVLTLVLPVSAQLQWTPRRGPWIYHVGAGPGVYRVWVENRRKVIKDPVTKVNHKGFYPGVSGQIGVERFLKASTSTALELSVAGHWAFADRPEQFPSGFNSALLGVEIRVGANYHFDPARFGKKKTEGAK
jgi:hypothetical protein